MSTSKERLDYLLGCEKPLTQRWSMKNGYTLKVYEETGGYQGLKAALGKKPDEVIETVKSCNIRGRGGAGFPAGMKWSFVPKEKQQKYLVVNADESEPGTFKDRYILERDPHALLEGVAIAAYAIGADRAYVFIRGEFFLGTARVKAAIKECEEKGILGKNIFGSGFDLHVTTHPGAGAYICGEETALLEALEGKRGYPRLKPPFPAVKGAFGKPTVINNVETLICAPLAFTKGPEWFAKWGVEKNGGTKVYCVSGAVQKPGVYELPHNVTLRELVFDIAGGPYPGHQIRGIVPGGSSVPILTPTPAPQLLPPLKEGETRDANVKVPEEWDVRLDFDSLRKVNSFLGSCAIMAIDDQTCIVRALLNLMEFYHHESCGQCTPCREGSGWVARMLHRFEKGDGTPKDIETIYSAGKNILGNVICALGDSVAMPTMSYIEKFRDDFERHVREHRCPYPHEEAITPTGVPV